MLSEVKLRPSTRDNLAASLPRSIWRYTCSMSGVAVVVIDVDVEELVVAVTTNVDVRLY